MECNVAKERMSVVPVNLNQPQRWKADIAASVDMYNGWFMRFAPRAFRSTRARATADMEATLRATGNLTDVRNAQEKRQLAAIKAWLEARGYRQSTAGDADRFNTLPTGTFGFRMNVPVKLEGGTYCINIPVDCVIMPKGASPGDLPIMLEAKSAGDFTSANKRRKVEIVKMARLRSNYGAGVCFNLFLCGY